MLSGPLAVSHITPQLKAREDSLAGVLASVGPTANAGPDQSVTIGTTVNFDGALTVDPSGTGNYTWTFLYDGHEATMYGPRPHFFFDKTGTYTVTLNVTDSVNNVSDLDQVIVRVSPQKAGTESLLYSGSVAVVVAALLLALFFAMRKSRGDRVDDGSEEEEFEDSVEEIPELSSKR